MHFQAKSGTGWKDWIPLRLLLLESTSGAKNIYSVYQNFKVPNPVAHLHFIETKRLISFALYSDHCQRVLTQTRVEAKISIQISFSHCPFTVDTIKIDRSRVVRLEGFLELINSYSYKYILLLPNYFKILSSYC